MNKLLIMIYKRNSWIIGLTARNSLTLFSYPFLLSITTGRSPRLHLVFAQNKFFAGRSTLARPCLGVHQRTSLMI